MLTPRMAQAERLAVLDELVSGAIRMTDSGQRGEVINALIPALSEDLMRRVLEASGNLPPVPRASSLTLIADHASDALLDELETAAKQVEDGELRAGVLSAVAQRMTGSRRSAVADEALAAISVLDDGRTCEKLRAEGIRALSSRLSGNQASAAIGLARQLSNSIQRGATLATLARRLDPADQQSVLGEVGKVLSGGSIHGSIYGDALPVLLRALPLRLLQPFLDRIDSAMTSERDKALAIATLAPVMTAEQRILALQIAQRLKSAAPMAQAVASPV